jgi:Tol biopolymer transport system component
MVVKRCGYAVLTAMLLILLVGACGEPESTPTALPPTSTRFAPAPTAILLPVADTALPALATPTTMETPAPTTTYLPPTDTALPPTVTLAPPTATSAVAATPDGQILFSVYPDGDIAVMNAGGSNQTLLLDRTMPGDVFSDRLAAWRPDGKRISYAVDDFEQVEIWVMDSDGSDAHLLVGEVAPVTSHSWSPDGKRIAFVSSQHDICILDLADQTITKLADERLNDERDPDWSPDGSRLAFSASDGQNQDIYVIKIDGTGLTRITSHEARDRHPDWSPDGTAIAFSSARRSQRFPDLYLLDLSLGAEGEGNMPLQLTAEDKLEVRPDWSPDRSWIVYLSHELGAEHGMIYAVNADGQSLVQLTADNVYHSPRWQP